MAEKTDYLENLVLEHFLRGNAQASPATIYAALFTVAPGEAGGGTEVTGGSYARQTIAFGVAAGGVVSNTGLVTFGPATAGWGTVVSIALMDALTAGNMLYYKTLSASRLININDKMEIQIGYFTVTEL